MIDESILIHGVASIGTDTYTCFLYFEDEEKAKHLNISDQIIDSYNNAFTITNATLPYVNGQEIFVVAVIPGTTPIDDQFYTSKINTPGQKRNYSEINTAGRIISSALLNPSTYEYSITSQWESSDDIRDLTPGDMVIDADGNSYRITEITSKLFNDVTLNVFDENNKAIAPKVGQAIITRPTTRLKLIGGTATSLSMLSEIASRNAHVIDQYLTSLPTGGGSGGGGGSDDGYEHPQMVPLSSWLVIHNLDRYPSVTVVDSAGSTVHGDVRYLDRNTVRIDFTVSFSGMAYFN